MNVGELKSVIAEQAKNRVQPFSSRFDAETKQEVYDDSTIASRASGSREINLSGAERVASTVISRQLAQEIGASKSSERTYNSGAEVEVSPDIDDTTNLFDYKSIATNVLAFVSSAVDKLGDKSENKLAIKDKLEQALQGIEKGFNDALEQLGPLVDESLGNNIEKAREEINVGMNALFNKYDVAFPEKTGNEQLASNSRKEIEIDGLFSFSFSKIDKQSELKLENLQINAQSRSSEDIEKMIARATEVIEAFYYNDIENAFIDTQKLGIDPKELALKSIDEISNIQERVGFPTEVTQYMNRMFDLFEGAKSLLGDESKYKSIINGLVNEMEDVQVPDLVSAINKFHSFNANIFGQKDNQGMERGS